MSSPLVAFLQNLMIILNFSYSEGCASDILRKSLGYVPVLWTLVDDFYGPEVAVKAISDIKKGNSKKFKTCVQGMWTKIMLNQGRYLILVDLIISVFADHVFTLLAVAVAFCIAFTAWMKFGSAQWTATGYLAVLFPRMERGGPKELRFLILMICTLLSALCFAVKYESNNLAILGFIAVYGLYALVDEKEFTLALAALTFNWPMLLLALIEKYPMTSSLRGTYIFKKQAAK